MRVVVEREQTTIVCALRTKGRRLRGGSFALFIGEKMESGPKKTKTEDSEYGRMRALKGATPQQSAHTSRHTSRSRKIILTTTAPNNTAFLTIL